MMANKSLDQSMESIGKSALWLAAGLTMGVLALDFAVEGVGAHVTNVLEI